MKHSFEWFRRLYSKGFQGVCLRLLEKKVLATEGVTNTRYYRAHLSTETDRLLKKSKVEINLTLDVFIFYQSHL